MLTSYFRDYWSVITLFGKTIYFVRTRRTNLNIFFNFALNQLLSRGGSIEAAINATRQALNNSETEAVLLIDTPNVFNCRNRSAAIHNIREL